MEMREEGGNNLLRSGCRSQSFPNVKRIGHQRPAVSHFAPLNFHILQTTALLQSWPASQRRADTGEPLSFSEPAVFSAVSSLARSAFLKRMAGGVCQLTSQYCNSIQVIMVRLLSNGPESTAYKEISNSNPTLKKKGYY